MAFELESKKATEEILDDFTEPESPPSRKGVDKMIWIYKGISASLFLFYDLVLVKNLPIELTNGNHE